MSMAELDDIASRLYAYRESQSTGFSGSSEETKLLADALLQAVREISDLASRISALESRLQSK
jgi:hypothetical protein